MAASREPERTCVGCRSTGSKRDLLRVARRPDGSVAVDRAGREPGRGAYVHRDPACVDAALRRGALWRALKTGADQDGAARLRRDIEEASRI